MSREIKYRAVHRLTKHWFDEDEIIFAHSKWFEDGRAYEDYRPLNMEQCAVMEYTGINNHETNDEIYEGDVVKGSYMERGVEKKILGVVEYRMAKFEVIGIHPYYGMSQELHPLFQSIGNIYDNPELLGDSHD